MFSVVAETEVIDDRLLSKFISVYRIAWLETIQVSIAARSISVDKSPEIVVEQ